MSGQFIEKAAQLLLPFVGTQRDTRTFCVISSNPHNHPVRFSMRVTLLWLAFHKWENRVFKRLDNFARFLKDWIIRQSCITTDLNPGPLYHKLHALTSCNTPACAFITMHISNISLSLTGPHNLIQYELILKWGAVSTRTFRPLLPKCWFEKQLSKQPVQITIDVVVTFSVTGKKKKPKPLLTPYP